MSTILQATVPGEPHAQGRPRTRVRGKFAQVYDPPESRSWKGRAEVHYLRAMEAAKLRAPAFCGPVHVEILAVFTCPKGDYRKRQPRPRRPHVSRGDADNLAKAVLDAGNGTLWLSDAQVSILHVEKLVGAQGEAPFVQVTVRAMAPEQERFRLGDVQPGA